MFRFIIADVPRVSASYNCFHKAEFISNLKCSLSKCLLTLVSEAFLEGFKDRLFSAVLFV